MLMALRSERDAALAKAARLEKKLAVLLVREAATAALARHGAGASKLLLSHVTAALRVRDVDREHPRLVVVDPESEDERGILVDELVAELRRSPDFAGCFQPSKGNDTKDTKPIAANPWRKGPTFNATEQARLLKSNPTLAARLKEEAGVP